MSSEFEYVFPAIRGIQAGREYYVSMCPLRLIPRLFLFDDEELQPEFRAQRQLNKSRVPEMARYMVDNRKDYIFSALTASIDAEIEFEPLEAFGDGRRVGQLRIPMSARFVINDGQHRRAAIELALRDQPELGDESIAVVFFLDVGLKKSQQMFADLNRYAIRPSSSLGVLYDHRDDMASVARTIVATSEIFRDVVELEKTSLSARSRRLFTLSAIYHATRELLQDQMFESANEAAAVAREYWEAVAAVIPEWSAVKEGRITAGEVRQDFLHSHGVVLQALGRVGGDLLTFAKKERNAKIKKMSGINWRRANTSLWEGRAMVAGRVSKSLQNVILTGSAIKKHIGLELSPEELRLEEAHAKKGE
ncbi:MULTISPECIES: DNA sulfur modification protein DndB [Kordiimonas]|uniref:DNA sulfur modification protein DndB n=1 Tax=Kordiimonas TaxID=288021 RepID=UPI0025801776|nr:DNA sulfur modification protein DndB [Kordiimonas sp. UBA4487]